MSKIGKKPIQIPKDTIVKVESGKLILTGPKGSRKLKISRIALRELASSGKIPGMTKSSW